MEKTRNLSKAEYFEIIQEEYLIAQWRRSVYYRTKDKEYYTRLMGHKKEKIDDISSKHNLVTIFNSEEKLNEIRNRLFDNQGRPKFQLDEYDVRNYYCVGSEFSYCGEIWTLVEDNGESVKIKRTISGKIKIVDKSEICRIF